MRNHHSKLPRIHQFHWQTALLTCVAVIGSSLPAKAASFNFTYAPGTTLEQMLGYEMAGKYWSNYLADDVTLNIFIEATNMLPTNVIGGAIPGVTSQKFSDVRKALKANAISAADNTAVANMYKKEEGAAYDAFTTTYTSSGAKTSDDHFISKINLTRANAKALGRIQGNDPGLDAYILVSNLGNLTQPLSWNYYLAILRKLDGRWLLAKCCLGNTG